MISYIIYLSGYYGSQFLEADYLTSLLNKIGQELSGRYNPTGSISGPI